MILTYISDKPSLFKKGCDYFCFEIYANLIMNRVSFRTVNPYGEIAIYDSPEFEIKQGYLNNMVFIKNAMSDYYVIQLKEIHELDKKCDNVNGIWGAYYDGNKDIEEKIHDIVKKQAETEGFFLEKVVAV